MLFFGPSFRVTRNKLSFRDDLPDLLSTATCHERHMERKFRDWMLKCHSTLDRYILFRHLAPPNEQVLEQQELY
jgi:hypothetical protein